MSSSWIAAARDDRNAALLAAEERLAHATHEAEVEYSETIAKLRERYEADMAEASSRRLRAITPACQAYNRAVVVAEQIDVQLSR